MDERNIALPVAKLSSTSLAEAIATAQHLGFQAMTFGGNPVDHTPDSPSLDCCWDELDAAGRAKMRAAREAFARGVIHAPFTDLPLVSVNPHIEREALRQMLAAVRAAGALQLEVVTVHAALRPKSLETAAFQERTVRALRTLGDVAAAEGTRIGVENWRYPADPDEHASLLEAVDHPAVGATLDVGHIAYWYQRDGVTSLSEEGGAADYNARLLALLDRLGKRIIHLHVHDVRACDLDDHRPIGEGIVDFPPVMARLERLGFDGLLLLELQQQTADYPAAAASSRAALLEAMAAATAAPVSG